MPPKRKAVDDAGAAAKVSRRDGATVAGGEDAEGAGGGGIDGMETEALPGLSAEQLAEYEGRLKEIEAEREQLNDGSHPEIQKRAAVLEKLCKRRVQSAKRLRDLQIKNIEGLYDYEAREADAVFQVGVATLKKALSDELQAKVRKAKEAQQAMGGGPAAPSPKSTRGGAAAAAASGGDAASSSASDATANKVSFEPKGNHGGVAPASTRVERQLEALGSASRGPFAINETLTDAEVRGDLRRIVDDLKERASMFAESLPGTASGSGSGSGASKARPPGHIFDAAVSTNKTDAPSLTYAGRRFVVGQPVVVHSKLSGQDFAGVIERIEEEDEQGPAAQAGGASTGGEVLAKLADGTFVRVALSMLQTGRLSLQQPGE
mmetsp:Transcript_10069/g.23640  ORF Transcript_10069/g.23640 Transcript_10069/m.23640 type:complete len:377 (+) Transcript_10069:153-1283(+)|eukprot:CAMPEP_0182569334 /NCGR_PEP_ID=MMETSP1324-20130603/9991_1 /TAXON_ID=236786 /ORGANISM="Florenciella sp., Strain RCC1587" /LENGTH=376 /DNA_ID=CAMNT_0024783591 /DNA_START=73 /DNA_END=1203 /DNA_ORIENTATION=+